MPSDETIKTSVRLPKSLHAEIERTAAAGGMTANGEMVYRLRHDPRADSAAAVLSEMQRLENSLVDSLTRQNAVLLGALDRANAVMGEVVAAMSQVKPGSDAAALKREIEFARELINALSAHR